MQFVRLFECGIKTRKPILECQINQVSPSGTCMGRAMRIITVSKNKMSIVMQIEGKIMLICLIQSGQGFLF